MINGSRLPRYTHKHKQKRHCLRKSDLYWCSSELSPSFLGKNQTLLWEVWVNSCSENKVSKKNQSNLSLVQTAKSRQQGRCCKRDWQDCSLTWNLRSSGSDNLGFLPSQLNPQCTLVRGSGRIEFRFCWFFWLRTQFSMFKNTLDISKVLPSC